MADSKTAKEPQVLLATAHVAQEEKSMTPPASQTPEKQQQQLLPETKHEQEENLTKETKSNGGDDSVVVVVDDSFKEQTTRVSDLPDAEKKALLEFKQLVQEALDNHDFINQTPKPEPETNKEEKKDAEMGKTEEVKKQKQEIEPVKDETDKNPEEEKTVVTRDNVDDDGAKTVEAIEETIVAVSSVSDETEQKPNEDKETLTESNEIPEEVSIYGVPLLADDRSDVILLKFLRARDFKVKEAFSMLKNTIRWRKEFKIDELVNDLVFDDLDKAAFMEGFDKEGHPVCYNVYGEFQNKELYVKTFSDEEKRLRFLKWRIQFLEKSIRKLDFAPGGISTIVQINDLNNSPGPGKWELRQATKHALQLLQDNYPEFVAKQVFINVPWWYLAMNRMISPFLTQRTKSKFVFAGPSKSAETLFRYIGVEQVPVRYGGLSSKESEFETKDGVTEITVKPSAKHTVEFPVTEICSLSWEVRVVGWDVNYSAEFVPNAEENYTVIIQKARRVGANEQPPVISNSFKINEPGKVVITIENSTNKKKKLLYRLKTSN